MSGGIEAAADVATGALIGRAVEDRAGEGGAVEGGAVGGGVAHPHGLCLNCGTGLLGSHCHCCGQAGHVHRTLSAIGHDILHGVLHLEGKIWRTLPMLLFRPGELTRRFIAGERARFVSPLAIFLFAIFLMFGVMSSVGSIGMPEVNMRARQQTALDLASQVAAANQKLQQLDRERAAAITAGKPVAALDGRRVGLQAQIKGIEAGIAEMRGDRPPVFTDIDTGIASLDKGIAKANANPELMLYKLQSSAYKYSWALIPISVPFMMLLFLWRRGYRAYDHAVFVTYSLTFMTLMVTALTLIGAAGIEGPVVLAALCLPPFHIYRQLRGAYRLRRRSAIWRTLVLLVFAFAVLLSFVLGLLALGLMG